MSFGYVCKNNHISQSRSKEPEIVCKECKETAYWQALDCTMKPELLPEFKEKIIHDDKKEEKNTTRKRGSHKTRKIVKKRICQQCDKEYYGSSYKYCPECNTSKENGRRSRLFKKQRREACV